MTKLALIPNLRQRHLLAALAGAAVIATASPATASAQSACDGLGGKVDADQICQVHSATPAYAIDMSIPLDYPDQQAVTDYLTQDRADFLDWIAKFAPGGRNRPYMHDVTAKTYRSGTSASGTQSMVLTIDDDTGLSHEDHPGTSYQAFNYDLGKHAPVTFDTLFKPGTDPLQVLNPIVQRQLGKHTDAPVRDDLDATTYQNFALTDDAVIFFFGEDQVVADNNGPHQISVPRSELASLLM
jgi:uncharacterized protein DUF3298